MTTVWKYDEPVTITGDNLDGDEPEYKKLCIAPEATKDIKECYYDFELDLVKWTDNIISFYPPENLPANGVVILQLDEAVEKCFGSAGCVDSTEDVEREIGSFKVSPYISKVIEGNTLSGHNAIAIEPGKGYQITGTYFGDEKGKIYVRQPRGSREIPADKITSWTNKSILFVAPAEFVTGSGVSVNNGGIAQWYDFATTSAASSASSNKQSSSVKRSSAASSAVTDNASSQPFTDIDYAHPYSLAIDWAKRSGVLQGYPDGTFKPDRVVNRAEFLKIVLVAKGIDVNASTGTSGFRDVDETAWYAPFVRYAKAQGVIQGYPDGTFKPNQAVNFVEALKMAYIALGVETTDIGGEWYERFLQHALLNHVLFSQEARIDTGMSRKDVVWIVWRLMTNNDPWQQPSRPIKDGSHIVGTDVQPGTYRTRIGSSGCYYERLSGFSGELEDIIVNENTDAPAVITIAPTDKGFKSSQCGTWTQDLSAITTSRTTFGDGVFIVGTDIEAGTYKSTGGSFCYYSRLSGFSGELEDIISNENTTSSAIVTISASDKGFTSVRCGTWTKIE